VDAVPFDGNEKVNAVYVQRCIEIGGAFNNRWRAAASRKKQQKYEEATHQYAVNDRKFQKR
jgi:hypothetical protein